MTTVEAPWAPKVELRPDQAGEYIAVTLDAWLPGCVRTWVDENLPGGCEVTLVNGLSHLCSTVPIRDFKAFRERFLKRPLVHFADEAEAALFKLTWC